MTARRVLVLMHRWIGLGLAAVLVLVGLTGALIAWNTELEHVFAPSLYRLSPEAAARPALDRFALREAAERAVPGFAVNGIGLTRESGEPELYYVEPRPGGPAPENDEIALDPSTGEIVGARRYGDLSQGVVNLMPFIYSLHDSLALGQGGATILGIAALAWTLDCFVGAWLTFPARAHPRRAPARWFARWRHAWRVPPRTGRFKLPFDLHNAFGLWLWLMLLVLAWSSVGFNLPSVYQPVMLGLFGADEPSTPVTAPSAPRAAVGKPDWRRAHDLAQSHMQALSQQFGFEVISERLMFYDPAANTFAYRVKSTLDPGKLGNTQLIMDADTGAVLDFRKPTGGNLGTTLSTWLSDLHTAGVFGWPMQVFVSLVGCAIVVLSVTGVLIWLRKRRSAVWHRRRLAARPHRRLANDAARV